MTAARAGRERLDGPAPGRELAARRAGRERLVAVVALAALGVLLLIAGTATWATVVLDVPPGSVAVTGPAAAPALSALSLALLALAAALSIAGRAARAVLGVLLLLIGAAVVALALPAGLDPARAATTAITAKTALTGGDTVRQVIRSAVSTIWPFVAAACGPLLVALGVAVLARTRRWPVGGRRYRPARAMRTTGDPVDDWDLLTRGADPTGPPAPPG